MVGAGLRRGCTPACSARRGPRATGISVAAHLEPYAGRTVAGTVDDVALPARPRHPHVLRLSRARPAVARLGCRERGAARGRRDACSRRRRSSARPRRQASTASTPTTSSSTAATSSRLCTQAHEMHLHLRAVGRPGLRRAARQRRPDGQAAAKRRDLRPMWRAAIAAQRRPRDDHVVQRVARGHPDRACGPSRGRRGRYRYLSYDGAWGLHGRAAEYAYLVRTRYWSDVLRSTSPAQPNTKPRRRPLGRRRAAAGDRGRRSRRATPRARAPRRPRPSRSRAGSRPR